MTENILDFDWLSNECRKMYEEKIPFNKVLGLQIETMQIDQVHTKFKMRPELVGNFVQNMLHGGVISSVLDATGGLMASISLLHKMLDQPIQKIEQNLTRLGTIDLRVDYLRPGQGEYFISTASIMRAGRKVSVTRMEMHNDQDLLIAVGTGTYIVG